MKFNDKPRAKVYLRAPIDWHYEANRTADHIEEHLDRLGYNATVTVKYSASMDDIAAEMSKIHDDTVYEVVKRVMLAHYSGALMDVFGLDNPDNAAYDDLYAPFVSVKDAVVDGREREACFDSY